MSTPTNITYEALVALLPSYLERKDDAFKDQIPTFINLAENRLATDMKQEGFQGVVNGSFDTSNVVAKPAYWRETLSFSYTDAKGAIKTLKLRSLEYLKMYWPNVSLLAPPEYYADYNFNNFYIAATPDITYDFQLVYYARLDPLTPEHQTNWMTTNAPQTLLYATLLEASLWAKNAEATQKWMQQYQIAVGGIKDEDNRRKKDRNAEVTDA